jgi:hypothetical protein
MERFFLIGMGEREGLEKDIRLDHSRSLSHSIWKDPLSYHEVDLFERGLLLS